MQTANTVWLESIDQVMDHGEDIKVRGSMTKEITDQTIRFDMNEPVCYHPDRKLSYIFMAAEAYWITSGALLTEEIAPYNKHIAKFSDDGHIFNGAYGPMFMSQIEYVVNQLYNDQFTRQAVMTIWVPNPVHSKDYRCTVSLVFQIRNNELNVSVLMRSNDLILGRPYDMFNFTIMALRILTRLNAKLLDTHDPMIKLGHQTLHAVSAHIYDSHYDMSNDLISNPFLTPEYRPMPERCFCDWPFVVRSLLACRNVTEDAFEKDQIWRIRP